MSRCVAWENHWGICHVLWVVPRRLGVRTPWNTPPSPRVGGCGRQLLRWPQLNTSVSFLHISQGSFSCLSHTITYTFYIRSWKILVIYLLVCVDCPKANNEQPRFQSLGGKGHHREIRQYMLFGVSSFNLQQTNLHIPSVPNKKTRSKISTSCLFIYGVLRPIIPIIPKLILHFRSQELAVSLLSLPSFPPLSLTSQAFHFSS